MSSAHGKFWLLVVAFAALACSARTPIHAPSVAVEPLPAVEPEPYRLGMGDVVAVRFWGSPELDEEVRIRPDGMISLPFIDEVVAAGRTPAELDAELTRRYTGELAEPEITVILRETGSRRVYVGGEVERQGVVELGGPLTLVQAIQEVGGFLTTARRKQVLLIRTTPEQRIARAIDVRPILSGRDLSHDVLLQPSDVIFVPRTKITNVNLFVDQYVTSIVPLRPVLTIPVFDEPLFNSGDGAAGATADDGGAGDGGAGDGGAGDGGAGDGGAGDGGGGG